MNIVEYKPVIAISLICLMYCVFWALVYKVVTYFKKRDKK